MKFVTKEEFDKAIATIKLAVDNRQVRYSHYSANEDAMVCFYFSHLYTGGSEVSPNQVTFASPEKAAKDLLLEARKDLEIARKVLNRETSYVEQCEKKEKELSNMLAALKENK